MRAANVSRRSTGRVQSVQAPGRSTGATRRPASAIATTRAGHLFGAAAGPYLTPQAVAGLAQALQAAGAWVFGGDFDEGLMGGFPQVTPGRS